MVAAFAMFHGYAHGAELPESANAILYSVGFILATGLLHGLGILLGVAKRQAAGMTTLRFIRCTIALCGVYLLIPQFAAT
jgi:urease accessory protein